MEIIIERTAKLFEAGDYPDKNISVTEADLDGLASSFVQAPVKVEHIDTPFDGALGILRRVWREGRDLMGVIGFARESWALIDRAGARKLSIAIAKDLSRIIEVSLVKNPRISGAQVFQDRAEFCGEIIRAEMDLLEEENRRLLSVIREREADAEIFRLKHAGKVVPACEEICRVILMNCRDGAVKFGAESLSPAELFVRFLESMPALIRFDETAKSSLDESGQFTPEQARLLQGLGVQPEDALKYS